VIVAALHDFCAPWRTHATHRFCVFLSTPWGCIRAGPPTARYVEAMELCRASARLGHEAEIHETSFEVDIDREWVVGQLYGHRPFDKEP